MADVRHSNTNNALLVGMAYVVAEGDKAHARLHQGSPCVNLATRWSQLRQNNL